MRSVDLFLGAPFDIASYALLTHIVAQETGYTPGRLTAMLGDCHIYNNHLDAVDAYITAPVHEPPTLQLDSSATIDNFDPGMVELIDYRHEKAIPAVMAV